MRFSLTVGQRADVSKAIPLWSGIEAGAVIADKGYESNRVLAFVGDQGAEAVIPSKSPLCSKHPQGIPTRRGEGARLIH